MASKKPSPNPKPKTDFNVEGHTLSIVGHDFQTIPEDLGEKYGKTTFELSIKSCQLRSISNLSLFTKLSVLVLDNNQIGDDNHFPSILNLETLWVNHNKITRLDHFLSQVSKCFPQIAYLSLLKNPCCPNYFIGKSNTDYLQYRERVVGTLPTLRFLDTTPVSPTERAKSMMSQATVARLSPSEYKKRTPEAEPAVSPDKGLHGVKTNVVEEQAVSGRSKYTYVGKHSEGNRFIRDKSL